MENNILKAKRLQFYPLKLEKKQQLTKNTYALELSVPEELKEVFRFEAGQYVPVQYEFKGKIYVNDYSMTSAPYEHKLALGVKVNSPESSTNAIVSKETSDTLLVAAPQGRFTLVSKPHEFRTILGFAAGIGITPILSHFKNILRNLEHGSKHLRACAIGPYFYQALSNTFGKFSQIFKSIVCRINGTFSFCFPGISKGFPQLFQ